MIRVRTHERSLEENHVALLEMIVVVEPVSFHTHLASVLLLKPLVQDRLVPHT